ncbi:unnamed protein product [Lactuca virosa]|uniref:Glutamine amidotransferase type-2 domain-containing protein n=1 Tax=Lactuca virosa TaxID=75947 RepID=A0AAU9PEP9_9ASTR|nr:unnamed protein product [Lactuca virosa]
MSMSDSDTSSQGGNEYKNFRQITRDPSFTIVDHASGDQPLYNEDKTVIVTVNGEIYNHKALREQPKSHKFNTGSDCEVITHLYEEYGEDFVHMLDGMFSFVLLDTRDKSYIAARDAIGITPLYMGWGLDGSVWFASEMKALSDDCEQFMSFLPGHIYSSKVERIPSTPYDSLLLRHAFEKAVVKRLMTDVPFVGITAAYFLAFCIGLKGSPDLSAAKEVADYLGTRHHEFYFTVQEHEREHFSQFITEGFTSYCKRIQKKVLQN